MRWHRRRSLPRLAASLTTTDAAWRNGASFFFRREVTEFVYEHWDEDVSMAWPGQWNGVLRLKYGDGADKNYVGDLACYYMMVNGMLGWCMHA